MTTVFFFCCSCTAVILDFITSSCQPLSENIDLIKSSLSSNNDKLQICRALIVKLVIRCILQLSRQKGLPLHILTRESTFSVNGS